MHHHKSADESAWDRGHEVDWVGPQSLGQRHWRLAQHILRHTLLDGWQCLEQLALYPFLRKYHVQLAMARDHSGQQAVLGGGAQG